MEHKWMEWLTVRQQQEVEFAKTYARGFHHGTDGHNRLMLIDKLARILDVQDQDDVRNRLNANWEQFKKDE